MLSTKLPSELCYPFSGFRAEISAATAIATASAIRRLPPAPRFAPGRPYTADAAPYRPPPPASASLSPPHEPASLGGEGGGLRAADRHRPPPLSISREESGRAEGWSGLAGGGIGKVAVLDGLRILEEGGGWGKDHGPLRIKVRLSRVGCLQVRVGCGLRKGGVREVL
jgi:hypothetical protein